MFLGGVGFGWDLATMTRSSSGRSTYAGLGQSYKDFTTALSFLGSNGPIFEMILRLMHDPAHLYDFPVSQLPVPYHTNLGSLALTAYEYYLYHFANLLVRRQKQNMAPTNVNVNVSNETLYVLLLEDYLTCFLPTDPAMQAKLFTQTFQPNTNSVQSPKQSPPCTPANPSKPSLFKKNFSPRFEETNQEYHQIRSNDSTRCSNETWRSETMIRIFILFWIEGYVGQDQDLEGSPAQSFKSMDYVSASIKAASSLPSAELMRVVRMFIKHSHYFSNACQQGSPYLPANMKIDIFSSKMNKLLLLSYFGNAIDHWPYDASFRLVLETWLSYIQPWRYLNMNSTEETALDLGRFSSFIGDNFMFYSKLLAKILKRFQRLDISSAMNAFMLFRVFKVMSQDHLFAAIKNFHDCHHYQSATEKKMENIFSPQFKDFIQELLCTALKTLSDVTCEPLKNHELSKPDYLTSFIHFINGGSLDGSLHGTQGADAEKAEREKLVHHLTLVTEKMSAMFELNHVLKDFKSLPPPPSTKNRLDQAGDQTDYSSTFGLSPVQRRNILYKKTKMDNKYLGNPDLIPIRSDEVAFLVRLLHLISIWINGKFTENIEETYHRDDFMGMFFREIAAPPTTYYAKVEAVDSSLNMSFHGMPKSPVKLPPRIILRPLGSHFAVAYLTIFFVVMTFIFGKSFIGSFLTLGFLVFGYLAVKAFVHPKTKVTVQDVHFMSTSF